MVEAFIAPSSFCARRLDGGRGVASGGRRAAGRVGCGGAGAAGDLDLSVFDLAASRVFAVAARLVEIAGDPSRAEARLGVVAADAVTMPAGHRGGRARRPAAVDPARHPRRGGARDRARRCDGARACAWPPYRAAKAILAAAFFPEDAQGFDPEAPDDLLPRSGVYPTERVFYRRLVLDAVAQGDGTQALENAEAIDLTAALGTLSGGFKRLATGALLTFSQSWFSQGLTLGPVAAQDVAGARREHAHRDDRLVAAEPRRRRASRSARPSSCPTPRPTAGRLDEVTNATAHEFQTGSSTSSVTSTTEQAGAALGFELGPIAFGGSASARAPPPRR